MSLAAPPPLSVFHLIITLKDGVVVFASAVSHHSPPFGIHKPEAAYKFIQKGVDKIVDYGASDQYTG